MRKGRGKEAKKFVIKRELTLDNHPTGEENSYWCGIEEKWGPLLRALTLPKVLMTRVLNVHHSGRWYTKRQHAHLEELEQTEAVDGTKD